MIGFFPVIAATDSVMSVIVLILVMAILHNAAGRHVGRERAVAALCAFLGALGKVALCVLDVAFWFLRGTLFAVAPDKIIQRATLTHGTTALLLLSLFLMLRAGFRATDTTFSKKKRAEMFRNVKPPIRTRNVRREQEG